MDAAYWDRLAGNFSEEVFEVTERDSSGVIRKTAKRLGGKDLTAIDFGCGAGIQRRSGNPAPQGGNQRIETEYFIGSIRGGEAKRHHRPATYTEGWQLVKRLVHPKP